MIFTKALRRAPAKIAGLRNSLSGATETRLADPRLWLCVRHFTLLADLFGRSLLHGTEFPARRMRALLHTLLGACYALKLKGSGVEHIHVHHGYFASWIAMVAARLLGIPFSMTLHGSDLLLHGAYLDTKLKHCAFCVTVSEFNRRLHSGELSRCRCRESCSPTPGRGSARHVWFRHTRPAQTPKPLMMLAVGRLHPVKDHAFLLRACPRVEELRRRFRVPDRRGRAGASVARAPDSNLGLEGQVKLLGHLGRQQLDAWYAMCDVVVLTSRSEGIPLVLMEAMAHGKTVLAPAITGIPELVKDGETGFLYRPVRSKTSWPR